MQKSMEEMKAFYEQKFESLSNSWSSSRKSRYGDRSEVSEQNDSSSSDSDGASPKLSSSSSRKKKPLTPETIAFRGTQLDFLEC